MSELSMRAEALIEFAAVRRELASRFVAQYRRLVKAGVPDRALGVLYCDRFDGSAEAVKFASEWAKRSSGTFVLSGPTGTSKTCAGAVFLRSATSNGFSVAWHCAVRAANIDFDAWHQLFEEITCVDRLVIDDIGAQGTTMNLAAARLTNVILARSGSRRVATMVITNLEREQFAEIYDGGSHGRLLDRVREDGAWVSLAEPSRREAPPDLTSAERELADAEAFLNLCERVERGSARWANPARKDLDKLQGQLGIAEDQLQGRVCELEVVRQQTEELLHGLMARCRLSP